MSPDQNSPNHRQHRDVEVSGQEWESDVIADFLKAYGYEYVPMMTGASFRAIEDSIINYNDDVPQLIETPHEGISVEIAHGYAKATSEPAVCLLHNGVGTLHGVMGLFNAFIDRVPVVALAGGGPKRKSRRRTWIDWIHSSLDQGSFVRDSVKWYDEPVHIDGVTDSLLRAHRVAQLRPKGPVYVTLDHDVQENELDDPISMPDWDLFETPSPMAPDPDAIERIADTLVEAELPVAIVDQVGDSPAAVDALVELAETLGMPVVDIFRGRFNFPNTHSMDFTGTQIFRDADVVVAFDVWSANWALKDTDKLTHDKTDLLPKGAKFVDVGSHELGVTSPTINYYEKRPTDEALLADTRLALPALVEAVSERLDDDRTARERADDRIADLSERHRDRRAEWRERGEETAGESPLALPFVATAMWDVIKDEEWVLVEGDLGGWAHRIWEIDEWDQYVGSHSGGAGLGYGPGAAIGGALAYSESDRIPISLLTDGEFMTYPGALWILSHYSIPLVTVMYNNGAYYRDTEHRIRIAEHRGRDASLEQSLEGTGLGEPMPDYATTARSMGVNGYGPVENPDELKPALEAAWADALDGEPALVDVVCQLR